MKGSLLLLHPGRSDECFRGCACATSDGQALAADAIGAYRRLRGRARHEEAAEERIWVTHRLQLQDPAMLKAAVLLTASAAASAAAAAFLTPISTQVSQLGSSFRSSLFSLRQDSFAQPLQQTDVDALCASKLVIFGELHETLPCIEVQRRTASCLLSAMNECGSTAGALHIVLEHFNYESQPALSAYASGSMSFDSLADAGGYEGHDIQAYRVLLQLARDHPGRVNLHAGFIPRHYARMVMREGAEPALAAASSSSSSSSSSVQLMLLRP